MSNLHRTPFDSAVAAVGWVWLDSRLTVAQVHEQAGALVSQWVEGADRAHLQAISLAFESLRYAVVRLPGDAQAVPATEAQVEKVRRLGWPRATALAEAAWAWARLFDTCQAKGALAMMQAHRTRAELDLGEGGTAPAIESVWLYAVLCLLHCVNADHDESLVCGLRAEALAHIADHDLSRRIVAQNLAFLYLSVGDLEAADAVLCAGIAAQQRCGYPGLGLSVNQLLALVVSRRFDAAARLLDETPELQRNPPLTYRPTIQSLVARVRLSQGRLEEAADLPDQDWSPTGTEPHTLGANRLWVSADVRVGLGRHEQARSQLLGGLRVFAEAGVCLLPMNATQLHRALADACEAAGDLPAALAALRQSQAHCFAWVGQSLRARLQALHFNVSPDGPGERRRRQDQRLIQVERALATAQNDTQAAQANLLDHHKLLAQVTHEVRNPLHGVVWMTSLLMMSDLNERQREYLNLANSSASMALSLCNDVLDLARLEAGKLQLRTAPLRLGELVAECAQLYATPARAKGVELTWRCDPALPPQVMGDRLRLQQVLMNLLSNATKFTRAGRIDVGVNWLGDRGAAAEPTVRLSVADTGGGLSEELMPRLFEEFEQAADQPASGAGAGLGLALCRQFVRLMGGQIGVRNRPGRGCTFWCLLPLRAV